MAAGTSSASWRGSSWLKSHSVGQPWPCTWQVLGAAPSCTHPVVCGGVHWVNLCTSPLYTCSATFRISASGTIKGSALRGVQGWTQLSPIVILGTDLDTLFSTWWLHCGACTPIGTGPIPGFWWYSKPDALCITHSRTVDSGGCSWLPNLSSQSSRQILLPTLQVWRNFHNVGWLTLPS